MNETEALLNQLQDVDVPPVAQTIALGWWLLLLLFVLLCALAFYLIRRWRSRAWQRHAKRALQDIRDRVGGEPSAGILSSSSQLARRVVLAVDERAQVANLHGELWLEKLDDVCRRPEFTQGIGRLLVDQAYQRTPKISNQDLNELLDSIDLLIGAAASYKPADIAPKVGS